MRWIEAFKGRNVIVEVDEGDGPLDQFGLKLEGTAAGVQRFPVAIVDGRRRAPWEMMQFDVSFPSDARFSGTHVVLAVRDEHHSFEELFRGTTVMVNILLYGSAQTLIGRGSGVLRFAGGESGT